MFKSVVKSNNNNNKDFAACMLKEENLFLKLADAITFFDFHFNLEFVLFGVLPIIYLILIFVIGLFEFEVFCINSNAYFLVLDRNIC